MSLGYEDSQSIGPTPAQCAGGINSIEVVMAKNGFIIKQNGYFTIAKTIDDVYDWMKINFKCEDKKE